ncbi:MAG: hypothetical protein JW939_08740, partial [Candidatus Thermoplasmatota archaeon]|nr:hypothetical protein [Candidatus Thermoplasmatota archaeon]
VTQGAYGGIRQEPLPPAPQPAPGYNGPEDTLNPPQQFYPSGEQPGMEEQPQVQRSMMEESPPIPFQAPDAEPGTSEQDEITEEETNTLEQVPGLPGSPPPLPPDLD